MFKKKKKKGFTLVELLAVIVILAVVILIAVTAVIPRMNKAKKNAFIDEALIYLKAAEQAYAFDGNDIGSSCINITDLNDNYVKKSGDNYVGTITTELTNGDYVQTISLTNGKYYLVSSSTNISSDDVKDSMPQGFKSSCGNNNSIVAQCSSGDSSCPVTLPASLDGYSSVDVVIAGKNLIYPKYSGRTNAGITYTVNSDYTITLQGTATATSWAATNLSNNPDLMQILPAGTYTLTGGLSDDISFYLGGKYIDGSAIYHSTDTGNGRTIILTKEAYVYPQIKVESGTVITSPITVSFMVEQGSNATTFEPYHTPITHTVPLGRPIYGGSVDVVKGEGTEEYTKVKLSELNWTQGTASNREYYNAVISTAETTNTHDIVTDLTYSGMVTVANMTNKSIAKWQQNVRIYDTDISSVSQLLETYGDEYILYPSRYITDFTFEPVNMSASN